MPCRWIAPEEAEARFEEAVEVMLRAWTTRERFSHKGRFWHFEDVVVEPPPAQRPHPPLWVAAGNPHSIKRAGARGFNLILDQYASPELLGQRIALYRAERTASGLAGPGRVAVARQGYVADNRAEAEAARERQAAWTRRTISVARTPGASTGSHVLAYASSPQGTEAHALFGTPDEVCRTLEAMQQVGVEYVIVTLNGGQPQLRRFARDVMSVFPYKTPAPMP